MKKKYFINNNVITFYSNNSRIISQNKIQPDVICSGGTGEIGAVLYHKDGDTISFLSKNNGITWNFKTYSYPFLMLNNNIIFLLTGENAGYSILSTKGEIIGEPASSGVLLTTFDISSISNFIIIGCANGNIKLFNETLKELWFKKVLDSEIQIVKKVSASSGGNYFAAIIGLEPEYLIVIDKNGTTIWKYITKENRRRPVELKFSQDEKYIIEECDMGFRLYSIKNRELILTKYLFNKQPYRQLISMDISCDGKFIIVSYRLNETISMVELFDCKGHLYFRLYFENETPYVAFSFINYNFQVEIKNKIYLYNI